MMIDKRVEAAAKVICLELNGTIFRDADNNEQDEAIFLATASIKASDAAAWQPIETAPRDGTSVLTWGSPGSHSVCETRYLVVGPYIHRVDGARFQKEPGWYWSGWDGAVGPIPEPTHWQPLPAPPSDAAEGEG